MISQGVSRAELLYPAGESIPPADNSVPVLREYIGHCIDDAHAYGQQDNGGVEKPPGGDEHIGADISLSLYVSLIVACLPPEAGKVKSRCKADEDVEDIVHLLRAEYPQQHEQVGEYREAVRCQTDEDTAEPSASAVIYHSGAVVGGLEGVDLTEKHHAHYRMGQLMGESLKPFLVLAHRRDKHDKEIRQGTAAEPQIHLIRSHRVHEHRRDIEDDYRQAEYDDNKIKYP